MDWRTAIIKSIHKMAIRKDREGNRFYRDELGECKVFVKDLEEPLICKDKRIYEGYADWRPVA